MLSLIRPSRPAWAPALGLAVSLLVFGCGQRTTENATTTGAQPPTENPAPDTNMTGGLTDANVAAIVVAANDAEIDLGKLAQTHARSARVQTLARQMVTDHTAVNQKAKDLAGRLQLTPEDNATSNDLRSSASQMHTSLEAMKGADFDRAYVDNEVRYHENLLNAIDNTLMPATQNDQLRQLLTETRPAVVGHLEHAKQVQAQLGAPAAATH